jgi:hypothetical protein
MPSKSAIKAHFKRNKHWYFLGIGFAVGLAVAPKAIQIIIKSPGAAQTIELTRRMHPGFRILCEESGVQTASANQMAKLMDATPLEILKQARGLLDDVDGFHYRILGEM